MAGPGDAPQTVRALAPLAAALAVSLFQGCVEKPSAPDAGERPKDARVRSPTAPGLRVPLPNGWEATSEDVDTLVAGPRGRAVIRIARSKLDSLPSSKSLSAGFYSATAAGLSIEPLSAEDGDHAVTWIGRLRGKKASEKKSNWNVMLGARRVKETIFLCATLPGATDAEVKAATGVCEGLGE